MSGIGEPKNVPSIFQNGMLKATTSPNKWAAIFTCKANRILVRLAYFGKGYPAHTTARQTREACCSDCEQAVMWVATQWWG